MPNMTLKEMLNEMPIPLGRDQGDGIQHDMVHHNIFFAMQG